MKMRREYAKKGYRTIKQREEDKENEEDQEEDPNVVLSPEATKKKEDDKKKKIQLSKEQSFRVWDALLKNVPTEYDFVIKSCGEKFPKGS